MAGIYEKSADYQKTCNCLSPCELLRYDSHISTADFPSMDAAVVLNYHMGQFNGYANDTQKGFEYFR